ncbi:MAG TPA: L-threonylcarbamoyladenylate synthase [Oligoflexia bacterium]|nr:L-threonylcarbamoyladenylate synthase [Oligoflexia bacterium]
MHKTEFLTADSTGIERAAQLLLGSELVGIPTETVYGLAALAFDETAVLKIFRAKERPLFDPLIVHLPATWNSVNALGEAGVINPDRLSPQARTVTETLMEKFWPGPLTLVLPRGHRIKDLVTSGLGTVGLRVPRQAIALKLLERVNEPLAAPSANRFGRISPTLAAHVMTELEGRISAVLDGGPSQVGVESTIVAIDPKTGDLVCLRPGGVAMESLELALKKLGTFKLTQNSTANEKQNTPLPAPGLLLSHYAPTTKLLLQKRSELELGLRDGFAKFPQKKIGVLLLSGPSVADPRCERLCVLSEKNDESEMAQKLFATLRELDVLGLDLILAEYCDKESGLLAAIQDRLLRAAGKSKNSLGSGNND